MPTKLALILSLLFTFSSNCLASTQQAPDTLMCQYAVDHMIQIAKQSLNDKKSRPERIKKRKQKVEEWVSKIKKGDDPCDVYADIQKSGNTF